jgi:hypothetical protein
LQQKPGTQFFFFDKTSASARSSLKLRRLSFNKSMVRSFSSFEKLPCGKFPDPHFSVNRTNVDPIS